MNDTYFNQACVEIAFAKAMGWDDWTFEEETEEGVVRGYHVQWRPDDDLPGLVVHDDGDDEARWVLVTGEPPRMKLHGWTTVAEARKHGQTIGEG
jgi:hypothetical protein